MKKIAILQPGYLPWLGFFEQMARTELFVYMDDVQFTRKDWRSRNRIKTPQGAAWLTVPVRSTGDRMDLREAMVDYGQPWPVKQGKTLRMAYAKAPFAAPLIDRLEEVYESRPARLVDLDVALTQVMIEAFGIDRPIVWSSEAPRLGGDRNGRIIEICRHFGADLLYDGAAAKEFIDVERFRAAGVEVVFQDYAHPVYRQLHGDFISHLSAVDLLANEGPASLEILLSPPDPFS